MTRRRRLVPIAVETLESRRLLSRIVWDDEGSLTGRNRNDADGFQAKYGADATKARAIVEQAINDWSRVIADFNYTHVGKQSYARYSNTIHLSIRAANLGGGNLGVTRFFGVDRSGRDGLGNRNIVGFPKNEVFGKPYAAGVTLDDDGGGRGWYFDPDPAESSEFPGVVSASHAVGDLGGRYDFYTSALRLVGKAVGLESQSLKLEFAAHERFGLTNIPFDPRTGTQNLVYPATYADPRTGASTTTFTTSEGEGGLYPGPLTPSLNPAGSPNYVVLPNDLMTADPQPNTRDRISDIDAALLRKGYTLGTPMTIRNPTDLGMSVLASLDRSTGLLRISGDPTVAANQIDIAQDANSVYVTINGRQKVYPATSVRSIAVTETGDDYVGLSTTRSASVVGPGKGTLAVGVPAIGTVSVFDQAFVMSNNGAVLSAISYSGLAHVQAVGAIGQGTVLVASTAASTPLAITNVARVALGPNLDSILGPVDISGVITDLTIDDSAIRSFRGAALFRTAVTGLAPAPITFSRAELSTFRLVTPTAASSLIVADTPQNSGGNLLSQVTMGPGSDSVLIQRTTGSLLIDPAAGANTVSADFARLGGAVYVFGSTTSSVGLYADDGIPGVLASMGTYQSLGIGYVLAAGHESLFYSIPTLTSLTVRLAPAPTGSLGALLAVDDSAKGLAGFATYILLGGPTDVVEVAKSSGPLAIIGPGGPGYQVRAGGQQAQSLAGFNGQFTVVNAGLDVLDKKAAKAQVVGVAADRLTIDGANVLNLSGVTRLRYSGANLANTYSIEGTPGNDLTINGGTALDTFNIATTAKTLDGLGQVVVDGGGGGDRLIVDDSKAKAGAAYGVTSAPLFGLPLAAIGRGSATIYAFEFASATLTGSDLPGLYGVTALEGGIATTIRGGAGDDRFAMQKADAKAALTLDGGGGTNTLDYSALKFQAQIVPLISPAVQPGAAPLPPGLVAWYRAEGNPNDYTGQHNGNQTGVSYVSGEVGQGFQFSGSGSVVVANSPDFEPQSLTVETWVRPMPLPQNLGHAEFLYSKGYFDNYISFTTDNRLNFQVSYKNGAGTATATNIFVVVDPATWFNAWHHVAGTYDGSKIRLYIDGKLMGSAQGGGPLGFSPGSADQDLHIANIPGAGSADSGFRGTVDEFSLYNRALTDAEIQSIYNAGSLGKATAPATPVGPAPGVEVDLKTGKATGFAGGISRIQKVIGTVTSDILVGDGGANLDGGGGRDLLIAGKSASTLTSRGDSILIGGTTAYDADLTSLDAVLAAWTKADATYDQRVNALVGGLLAPGKVAGNGQRNTLTGGNGKNLFFDSTLDSTDRRSDETEVNL